MPKNLQNYLSKIKKPTSGPLYFSSNSFSSSKKWILSNCKHPKTRSFSIDGNQNINIQTNNDSHRESATLADIDRFLFENFKSLYIKDDEEEDNNNNISKKGKALPDKVVVEKAHGGILFDSPRFMNPPLSLRGSNPFFVDTGLSSSLMDEARLSITASSEDVAGSSSTSTTTLNDSMLRNSNNKVTLSDDCIALLSYSPSPYDDFRRSMQQMVEARLRHHDRVDWSFLEELLFCYLNLNEKKSYKFILSAFVDLIVALRRNSNRVPAAKSRNVRSTRQRRRETRDKVT